MSLGIYGGITTLITKVINDNVLLKLTTNNNMWLINQRATQVLMGPVLNALLYL